ncbi:MAG: helix-hairpin-helix domain-containing protein [Gemmatimonadales bacterium]
MKPSRKPDPLTTIPGIGPSMADDLRLLGYRRVADLARANPERMYDRLCELTHCRQDPCVLYVFRCAVYFASRTRHDADLLLWWNWMDRTIAPLPSRAVRRVPKRPPPPKRRRA